MLRNAMSTVARGRRAIHHLVFVEDHSIITRNTDRLDNVRDALVRLEPTLKKDTATVVKLNSGYYRPNEVVEFAKGGFSVDKSIDLKGNHGPSGLWGNIARVVKGREDKEVNIVVLTNGADDASKAPLRGQFGMEHMMRQLGERNPGLRYSVSLVGFDVTRETERSSIRDACNWTGGRSLFIDCDGADDDGTTLKSPEADKFFADFAAEGKTATQNVADAKKQYESNRRLASPLIDVPHTPPTF